MAADLCLVWCWAGCWAWCWAWCLWKVCGLSDPRVPCPDDCITAPIPTRCGCAPPCARQVSFILEDHQATLRHLFTEFAKGDGTALYDELKSAKLLSFNEWRMLTKNIGVMNEADFSQRDMALVFSWSRLRVIDERPMKSRVR